MRVRNVSLTLSLVTFLLSSAVPSALGASALSVDLTNEPTTLPRTDEGMYYKATVKNTSPTTVDVGDALTCKNANEEAGIQWLQNAEVIPGATGKTYTVTEADKGKSLQCKVTATKDPDGPGGTYAPITRQAVSLPPLMVAPSPAPAPPSGSSTAGIGGPILALPTGTATTTVGSNVLTDVMTAKGTGTLTAGSRTVTGFSVESGEFIGDGSNLLHAIDGNGIPHATGTATFVQDNTNEIAVSSPTGTFAVGQRISGTGTQIDGQIITAVGPGPTIKVTPYPAATGTFSFSANTMIRKADPGILELSAAATASGTETLVSGTYPFNPGHTLSGEGIPAGTKVLKATGGGAYAREIVMSNNATATKSGVEISGDTELTCKAPQGWSGDQLTWSFRWLRNDVQVGTGPTYQLTEADVEPPSALHCEATVEDPSGNKAVTVDDRLTVPRPPNQNLPVVSTVTVSGPNNTSGPVTLDIELPSGQETFVYRTQGSGWDCTSQFPAGLFNAKATCTRADRLDPGKSYPPLFLDAQLGKDAPETGIAVATVSGGGAAEPASDEATYTFEPDSASPFGMLPGSFEAGVFDEAGEPYTVAGGHPFRGYSTFGFNIHRTVGNFVEPSGTIKDVVVDVPRGFVGNALATPQLCKSVEDVTLNLCPPGSLVGGIDLYLGITPLEENPYPDGTSGVEFGVPIYSIEPEFGQPAQFSFVPGGGLAPYTFVPELRADEGYAISFRTAPIVTFPPLFGTNVNLCDFGAKLKGSGKTAKFNGCRKATEPTANPTPLITNPTRCTGPPPTARLRIDSWENPQDVKTYDFAADPITDCDKVKFEPEATLIPTNTQADSPTGLNVEFTMPTDGLLTPTGVSQANMDNATVTFPEGMTINAAAAEGLGACTLAQVQLKTNLPDKCPDSSKVGTIEIDTPLIRETLKGAVFVAEQKNNPFNETLGLYMVFSSARDGVTIKIAGKLEPDPVTGQLVSTFVENPEAPFSRLALKFNSGPRAPLVNPPSCGTYAIRAEFSPWSAVNPANPTPEEIVTDDSTYKVNRGPGDGACPEGELAPSFKAGLLDSQAGSKSPFVLTLSREDGTQRFTGVEVTNPKGLTAYLKGVSTCPESSLAAISPAELAGAREIASPSCPANSQVGTAQAGAGSGPLPFYVSTGKVYLAGPYKGAPVSLAIVTPAVAGPYDFGNVLVRTPLYVDPSTAQVTAISDPIPLSVHGIALNVRDIRVALDRPNFTAAPTGCEPSSVSALVKGQTEAKSLTNRFQASGCEKLGFKPKLSFRLFGGTKRGAHPKFRAILRPRPGDANIAAASVALPRSEFLENDHIGTICTRVQFAANQCPPRSIYGFAEATTPLLDHPVSGPVYLRSSSHELPDMVVALRGPDTQPIEVELAGRIDSVNGGIRSSFDVVPDQPVSSFTLTMLGGKKGLLVNSRDLCKGKPQRATAVFTAQNGSQITLRPELKNACKSSARKGKGKGKGKKPPKRR